MALPCLTLPALRGVDSLVMRVAEALPSEGATPAPGGQVQPTAAVGHVASIPVNLAWSKGDTLSILVGFTIACIVSMLRKKARTRDRFLLNFATGTAIGPLFLILLAPLNQFFGAGLPDTFEIVITDARITLYWAALYSFVYLIGGALDDNPTPAASSVAPSPPVT